MTGVLLRLEPASLVPAEQSFLRTALANITNMRRLNPMLAMVRFVKQDGNPLIFEFTIQVGSRTWISVLRFTGPDDTDPGITITVPGYWYDEERSLARSIRTNLVHAHVEQALEAFEMLWVTDETAPVSLIELIGSPGTAGVGATLTVEWHAPAQLQSTPQDWIALFRVGDPNTVYHGYTFVAGATFGTFDFATAGLTPGQYEFRYLPNNTFIDIARSVPITLT